MTTKIDASASSAARHAVVELLDPSRPDAATVAIVRAAFALVSANPAHLSREANALRRAVLQELPPPPVEYRGGGRP